MAVHSLPAQRRLIGFLTLLVLLAPPLLLNDYLLTRFTFAGIVLIAALGLNILLGLCGQISLGHGAFMSVGAYTAANLAVNFGWPLWLTLPAGGLMAAAVGAVIGIPSLRIKGMYIAIATLGGQKIVEWVLNHVPALTGGYEGVMYMPSPTVLGFAIEGPGAFYILVMAVAVVAVVATLNVKRSRLGRAFIAIREHDVAAEIIGVPVFRYKIYAFALSSFYAGVAGVLFTYFVGVANFEQFGLGVSIGYLAITIIGGLGSVWGTILGVLLYTFLPLFLGQVMGLVQWAFLDIGNVSQTVHYLGHIIFGMLIIGFLIWEPEGLNRLWNKMMTYFRRWPFSS